MSFLLDTNVVSELRKAGDGRADQAVIAWVGTVAPELFFISAITWMELEIGTRSLMRKDAAQGARFRSWLDTQVGPFFEGRVLPVDKAVAAQCAALHVPDRKSERDGLIAATALVHGMSVVTRNVSDFEGTSVALVNPWQEGTG